MTRKKVLMLLGSVCLALVLAVPMEAGCAPSTPAPTPKAPPMTFIMGTHEVGSGAHRLIALVIESMIERYPGLVVRAIPAGGDINRQWMARLGDVHTSMAPAIGLWFLQEGLTAYADLTWGPQPIGYLWIPMHPGMALAVRGDSDIYKVEDLRGRTVAYFPGTEGPNAISESMLAFGGLTWDDVVSVNYASPATGYRAVLDGKVDTSFFNVTSSLAYEGAALPSGLRYLEMPAEDTEGWERIREVVASHTPRIVTAGGGISEDNPLQLLTMPYPGIVAWNSADEDTIYWITRAIHESYDIYKTKNESLRLDWTKEQHWLLWDADFIPMHPGAVRYFKEIGDWTPEREQSNAKRLQHQAEVKKLWGATVDEALAQGMKAEEFPAFWLEKRGEAGLR